MEMPGWCVLYAVQFVNINANSTFFSSRFDLYSLGKSDDKEDEEGLLRSSKLIHSLVASENEAGIANERSTSQVVVYVCVAALLTRHSIHSCYWWL
jgi:hypothetical protein